MSLSFCAIYCTLSTASDGAENAIDHAVASFLVFWGIEKAELLFEAPPQSVKEAPLQYSSGASSMRKTGSGKKVATCGWQVS